MPSELMSRYFHAASSERADIAGRVLAVEPVGSETHVLVRVGELEVRAVTRGFGDLRRDDEVSVALDPTRAHRRIGQ